MSDFDAEKEREVELLKNSIDQLCRNWYFRNPRWFNGLFFHRPTAFGQEHLRG